jgi:hypothetical protein
MIETNAIPPPTPLNEAVVVTDACLETGLGAAVFAGGSGHISWKIFVLADAKIPTTSVCDREALVLLLALRSRPAFFARKKIRHYGDNSAAMFGFTRGGARSFALNNVVVQVLALVSSLGSLLFAGFVPGHFNPADGLTRRKGFSEKDLLLTHVLVDGARFGFKGSTL